MRAFKSYLYKRQTKKRNSLICLFLFYLLEALVLVLFRIFFVFSRVSASRSFLLKTSRIRKKLCKTARSRRRVIDIIFHENFCIRILHVDDIEHYRIKIFFFFSKILSQQSFLFSNSSFLLFLYSSAAASLHWVVESFQQFVLWSSSNVFEDVNSFEKIVLLTTALDDWCRKYIFYK